jgi:transcriptional regulator with XRE-family HTH domain
MEIFTMSQRTKTAKRNEAICTAYAKGTTQIALAKRYGLSDGRISQIVRAGQNATSNTNETTRKARKLDILETLLMSKGIDLEQLYCDGELEPLSASAIEAEEDAQALVKKPRKAKKPSKAKKLKRYDVPPKDEWTKEMKAIQKEGYLKAKAKGVPFNKAVQAGYKALYDFLN